MIDGLQADQQASAVPMSGVLSLTLQAHRHYRRSSMPGLTSLPFLGLRGLRTDTEYEIGTGQSATVDMPWHMGTGLTMIAPRDQKPEQAAKSPNQNPLASQAPLTAKPLVMQMPGTPDPTVSPMPERGAGSPSSSRPKQQHHTNEESPVQSLPPTQPFNPYDPIPFKDSLLQANWCVSHQPSATPGKPRTLPPKEICRTKEKRSDIAFSSQSAIASPRPETAPRPRTAKVQLSRIYLSADIQPETSLGDKKACPDPIAGLQPQLTSNPSDQDLRFKMRAAALPQKPASDHTGEPPLLASTLSGDLPHDFVRSPRSNLKVVSEIIEEVVERRLTKKLAAAQSTAPIQPESLGSVPNTPCGRGLTADPDQLARRMIRRINGINRAERFRSGYIR